MGPQTVPSYMSIMFTQRTLRMPKFTCATHVHFGQTLINCIHNQHRIGITDEYFVETCINTYTQNGFVTKEFVKIDEDSQIQDYTIIYIKFQGQTPPFSTHNRDSFERLRPTPFPQVGDILTEERGQ